MQVLIKEADWNGQNLAEAVNAVGREAGLRLAYSRSSVGQWISGMTPRRPVPHVVSEALSRRLSRPVTMAEAGFGETSAEIGQRAESPLRRLVTLAAAATDPRAFGTSAFRVYRLAESVVPTTGAGGRVPAADPLGEFVRVRRADVESAAEMLRLFTDASAAGGVGHVRPALGLYLADTMAPALHAAPPETRAELLPVATRLIHLCGLMCCDDELHGFGQQYYRVALRLAAGAEDAGPRALVLRAMSTQAVALGHYRHALRLARVAVDTATADMPAADLAALLGQRAVARAATGDRDGAVLDMRSAQSCLGRARANESTARGGPAAALACQRGLMLALLGEVPQAIGQLELSVRRRPATERHNRALILAHIADLRLRVGHLDEAITTWHRFLDEYPAISSGRARTALALLQSRIRPYRGNPAADALLTRARSIQQRLPRLAA
ncbi:hypothetical protein [Actinomadura chibensis]|uniref:Tetratricopeptide repeat protein n=1 Tax=Actinomadura chibensis TaxID=392828 RepID=A0A5D0NC53_9ACTN|nr:hypothetical protein [Actinomadura chibensis]TYB41841.1 hypothetical protein FXF69_33445 [Actinomadura chibensis]